MKRVINEKYLRNVIKQCISEALRYDKDAKRYFPNYNGNPHSDAGKFAANNHGNMEYSHNDYKWSNPENQKRFDKLQWQHHFEPDYTDPDRKHENNAEDYLESHEPYTIIDNAVNDLRGEFENIIGTFLEKAASQYPIFNERYYMRELIYKLRDILDDYDY